MKTILFVDDEQHILDGMRDMLRRQRTQWNMVFVSSGQLALAALEHQVFDLIVSDMRMPGMDGGTLLQQVKYQYPATARIILSGQAERGAVLEALPVAHQFLSKPCDPGALRAMVERVCGLHERMHDEKVKCIIGSMSGLPSLPQTYFELTRAAEQPDVTLSALCDIVEKDPAITAKVLQLVNSSYFGFTEEQTTVHQAVAYLGTSLLKGLALTAHVFSMEAIPVIRGFSLDSMQQHAVGVAQIARRFFRDKRRSETVFTAALIHDVGKIVLAMSRPTEFECVLRECTASNRPAHVVERELLGVSHAEVGAYLLGLWGLPLDIVEAVAYHHHPELAVATDTLVALHVADALSYARDGSTDDASMADRLNVAFIQQSSYGAELARWRSVAEDVLHMET